MSVNNTNRPGSVGNTVPGAAAPRALPSIPAGADAAALKDLFNATAPGLLAGRNPTLNIEEGKWLQKLVAQPGADASLKALVFEKVGSAKLTRAAETGGIGAFLKSLAPQPPVTSPGTVTTPGGTSTPVSTGTPGTGGTVFDARLGNAGPADSIAHYKGPATFEGPWKLKASALTDAYKGVKADRFGTTDVKLPTGGQVNVRDFHYDLGGGKVGMRFIPVADGADQVTMPDGTKVPGHKAMDDFLRKEMGLGPDEPVYALIQYIHPEMHTGDLRELASNMLKTEGGNTHTGAYVGGGRTTNSPENYHNNQWEVSGYPANVQVVQLEGVPQGVLNQNALIADTILNKGVKFPPDYKNDWYKTVDLKTTLEFYKKWVRDDPELKTDPKWHTYCAEHKTIVTNVMLNVPHNEAAFKEIFGDAEGAKFFGEVKARFKEISGKDMPETSFEPLWKKEGIANPAAETGIGKGLAWPPETTPDILNDFLNVYANFRDVGGVTMNAMMMGFFETLHSRTGIQMPAYLELAMPVLNKVMVAEARTQRFTNPAELQKWAQQNTAALYVAVGGKKEDFAPGGTLDPQKMQLAQSMMKGVEGQAAQLVGAPALSRDQARAWLNTAITPDLEKARSTPIGDPNKPQYFSPPNITTRVAMGIHEGSKFVTIRTLATAVDASELEPR